MGGACSATMIYYFFSADRIPEETWSQLIYGWFVVSFFSSFVWGAILLAVTPLWALCHALGYHKLRHAMIVGAVLPPICISILEMWDEEYYIIWPTAMVVAFIIHRIAYGRAPQTPAAV